MRFAATLAVLSAVGFAAAQTSSAAAAQATGCPAQNIVEACKTTEQSQIDGCKGNDWVCLCNTYQNLLTCYNNCPDSPEKPPVQNQVTQYCNAAAPIISASISSAASAGKTAAPKSSASATATDSVNTESTASATSSVTAAAHSGAAGALIAPATGVLAFFLGVAGLL